MGSKLYKFEKLQRGGTAQGASDAQPTDSRHAEIMEELAVLKSHICPEPVPGKAGVGGFLQGSEIAEALKLKRELDRIYVAIAETKREIASLSQVGFVEEGARPVDELDAVVQGTERATNQILNSVEQIENSSAILADTLSGDEALTANRIQDEVLKIYEACNFQDLTGQRISKVVNTLRFISERTDMMIEIWGGIDAFISVLPTETEDKPKGDAALLNGPALEDDTNIASQDDIDALFA